MMSELSVISCKTVGHHMRDGTLNELNASRSYTDTCSHYHGAPRFVLSRRPEAREGNRNLTFAVFSVLIDFRLVFSASFRQ